MDSLIRRTQYFPSVNYEITFLRLPTIINTEYILAHMKVIMFYERSSADTLNTHELPKRLLWQVFL